MTSSKQESLKTLLTKNADLIFSDFPFWARPVLIFRTEFSPRSRLQGFHLPAPLRTPVACRLSLNCE